MRFEVNNLAYELVTNDEEVIVSQRTMARSLLVGRCYINLAEVRQLTAHLQRWVDTGSLALEEQQP